MSDNRELLKLIDCCRVDRDGSPRADDLATPELRPLAEAVADNPAARVLLTRVQRADSRLRSQMIDVPAPAGLADRILNRLSEAAASDHQSAVSSADASAVTAADAVFDQTLSAGSPADPNVAPRRLAPWGRALWTRRYWLAAGAATAAALFVAVSWYRSPIHYTPERLLEAAREFDFTAPRGEGQLLAESRPNRNYRLSERIVATPDARWRIVDGFLGRKGVAYDVNEPGGASATLYVVQLARMPNAPHIDADRLRTRPAANPQPASGGARLAAWREEGRLYVLVVRGDDNAYRRLVRPAPAIAVIQRPSAAQAI